MSPRMPSTITPVARIETEAAALHRLAAQARERGIQVLVYPYDNTHYAPSLSQPGILHRLTLASCDCRAFVMRGRCVHHAAILELYGALPRIESDTGPDSGPDGGGAALAARSPRPVVEGVRTALAGTRTDGSTYRILHADAVVIDGAAHRVGDAVLATDERWGWVSARITCIRTVGSTGRVWKVDVDGTGYGETTRSLSELRAIAISSEEVRHAA